VELYFLAKDLSGGDKLAPDLSENGLTFTGQNLLRSDEAASGISGFSSDVPPAFHKKRSSQGLMN